MKFLNAYFDFNRMKRKLNVFYKRYFPNVDTCILLTSSVLIFTNFFLSYFIYRTTYDLNREQLDAKEFIYFLFFTFQGLYCLSSLLTLYALYY